MESNQSLQMLGFQLRVSVAKLPPLWPPDRRDHYLLKPTIDVLLSADPRVWPLVEGDLAERLFEDYTSGQFEAPNGLNIFQLRHDFRAALDALRGDEGHLAALSVGRDVAEALIQRHAILDSSGDHERACNTAASHALGYDVCDQTLLSGLMNCGVAADERVRLRATFASLLNKYGLFDSPADADAFSVEMSHLLPEHAPFFPVRLKTIGRWS